MMTESDSIDVLPAEPGSDAPKRHVVINLQLSVFAETPDDDPGTAKAAGVVLDAVMATLATFSKHAADAGVGTDHPDAPIVDQVGVKKPVPITPDPRVRPGIIVPNAIQANKILSN